MVGPKPYEGVCFLRVCQHRLDLGFSLAGHSRERLQHVADDDGDDGDGTIKQRQQRHALHRSEPT